MKNKKFTYFFIVLTCMLLPWCTYAQETTDNLRNFLAFSPDNPFFPIVLLLGFCAAFFTFFKPKFGLFLMLFFMLISTDMQLTGGGGYGKKGVAIRLEDIILVLVSVGWLLNRAKTRSLSEFKYVPINKSIILMALVIVIASILGYLQGTTPLRRGVLFTMKRLEYFWLFFMALNILNTDKEVKLSFNVLAYLTLLVCMVGIIQFYLFPLSKLTGGGATATSGLGRANTLADYFLIAGGVFSGLVIYTKSKRPFILYLLVASLCGVAIISTKSRGAYVSVPPLIFTILFFSRSKKALLLLLVGGGMFLFFQLAMLLLTNVGGNVALGAEFLNRQHSGDIGDQFESIKDVATQGPEADSSFYARYRAWTDNVEHIIENPILGHGVGSVPLAKFDCQYVRELYETGIVGMLIFLNMIFVLFMTIWHFFIRTEDPFIKGITCGFLGSIVGVLVHGWSIANFYTIMNMEAFWFIIALIMILYHNQNKSDASRGSDTSLETEGLPLKP